MGRLEWLMQSPRGFGICTRSWLVQELWSGFHTPPSWGAGKQFKFEEKLAVSTLLPIQSIPKRLEISQSWFVALVSIRGQGLDAENRRHKFGFSAYISAGRLRELEHAPPRRGGHVLDTLKKRFLLLDCIYSGKLEIWRIASYFPLVWLGFNPTAHGKMRSKGTCFLHFWSLWSEVW